MSISYDDNHYTTGTSKVESCPEDLSGGNNDRDGCNEIESRNPVLSIRFDDIYIYIYIYIYIIYIYIYVCVCVCVCALMS